MTPLAAFALLLTFSALFGILNDRTLRLPRTIGVLVFSLLASLALLALDPLLPGIDLHLLFHSALGKLDLPETLLNGVLSFLLFAGALQVDPRQLLRRWKTVLALALVGTVLAVGLGGVGMWLIFPWVDRPVPLSWCLVLGAILAPTDPVSVVGMLRRLGLPAPLQALFAGESLFNDGVGVVAFGVTLEIALGSQTAGIGLPGGFGPILRRFLLEALGGGTLGLGVGAAAMLAMRATRDSELELIISLALATGTFSLANALHMSGPIAVVTAGLVMAASRNDGAITRPGREALDSFWTLMDEVLNAILFLLIGFEVVAIPLHWRFVLAVLAAIPALVAVRAASVFLAAIPVHLHPDDRGRTLAMLTWGGLRGGISAALVLSLPAGPFRAPLLAVCYGVVVFSIVVQGLTIERLARRLHPLDDA